MSKTPDLPDPGERRVWVVTHNPKSSTKPLHIELKQLHEGSKNAHFSDLVGQGNAAAQDEAVRTECDRILMVAGRAAEFVGVHGLAA